jgi:hypothetical protein
MVNLTRDDYYLFKAYAKYGASEYTLGIYIPDVLDSPNDGLTVKYVQAGGSSNLITDTNFPSTNWQFVAVTWSHTNDEIQYFLNGSLVSNSTDIPTWSTDAPNIFEVSVGPAPYNISHLALWNSALVASDIENIYDVGAAANAVTMVSELGANSARITFYNPTQTTCYLTALKIRGKRVKQYRSVDFPSKDEAAYLQYGKSTLKWDMPYGDNASFGRGFSNWLLRQTKTPYSSVESVTFVANQSEEIYKRALALEPGSRIRLQETQTGIAGDFFVNGISYSIGSPGVLYATLYLAPAGTQTYWQLGKAGYSEIGETTVLAL